ncbi:hypothetical protein CC80DRAFT_510263 [Byssothecium circinans]|uniref:Uncharacterized protein n=1 Tax=Byssothecium circinans TaxID=147558 RepID=A0A6A5TDH3_9PLEO|nr:hypothetical protein CC80DRAFT_510263 [Byssothecium circinans]
MKARSKPSLGFMKSMTTYLDDPTEQALALEAQKNSQQFDTRSQKTQQRGRTQKNQFIAFVCAKWSLQPKDQPEIWKARTIISRTKDYATFLADQSNKPDGRKMKATTLKNYISAIQLRVEWAREIDSHVQYLAERYNFPSSYLPKNNLSEIELDFIWDAINGLSHVSKE